MTIGGGVADQAHVSRNTLRLRSPTDRLVGIADALPRSHGSERDALLRAKVELRAAANAHGDDHPAHEHWHQ